MVSAWTLLGSTYHHKLKKEIQAQTVFQHITASFPNDPLSEDVKPLIKEGPGNLNLLIDQLGNNLYDTTRVMIRPGVANDYIEACQLNALIHPDKVESADFLFKAGETARTIKQHQKAIDIYEWIFNSFSNHPKHGQALFLKAFILDSDLKKYPEAKTIYEEFMTKYPDDDFADDTQFLLNNLGKSDDEIIKSFEKQSQ